MTELYNKGKPTLAYMCYPYSSDPMGNTKKARVLAASIMDKHPNVFIILPHTAVDMTLFGEFHERASKHSVEDHERAENCEYVILSKIDLFIIGTDYDDMTSGMTWEHTFVKKLNRERRRQIDIKYASELLGVITYEHQRNG